MAAESHIRLITPPLLPGHRPFSHGDMNAIPAIAAYESWNPTSLDDPGENSSWTNRDVMRIVAMFLLRPVSRAVSLIRMNRNALVIEAPAPVAAVYVPHAMIRNNALIFFAAGLLPATESMDDIVP